MRGVGGHRDPRDEGAPHPSISPVHPDAVQLAAGGIEQGADSGVRGAHDGAPGRDGGQAAEGQHLIELVGGAVPGLVAHHEVEVDPLLRRVGEGIHVGVVEADAAPEAVRPSGLGFEGQHGRALGGREPRHVPGRRHGQLSHRRVAFEPEHRLGRRHEVTLARGGSAHAVRVVEHESVHPANRRRISAHRVHLRAGRERRPLRQALEQARLHRAAFQVEVVAHELEVEALFPSRRLNAVGERLFEALHQGDVEHRLPPTHEGDSFAGSLGGRDGLQGQETAALEVVEGVGELLALLFEAGLHEQDPRAELHRGRGGPGPAERRRDEGCSRDGEGAVPDAARAHGDRHTRESAATEREHQGQPLRTEDPRSAREPVVVVGMIAELHPDEPEEPRAGLAQDLDAPPGETDRQGAPGAAPGREVGVQSPHDPAGQQGEQAVRPGDRPESPHRDEADPEHEAGGPEEGRDVLRPARRPASRPTRRVGRGRVHHRGSPEGDADHGQERRAGGAEQTRRGQPEQPPAERSAEQTRAGRETERSGLFRRPEVLRGSRGARVARGDGRIGSCRRRLHPRRSPGPRGR